MKYDNDGNPIDEELAKPDPAEDGAQDIDIEEPEQEKKATEIDVDDEEATEKEFKQFDHKAFAAMRKSNKEIKARADAAERKLKELESKNSEPVRPYQEPIQRTASPTREHINGVPVPQTKQEWDALARQDWQTAVDLRSIINSRRITVEARQAQESLKTLEGSKNKVLTKHPELDDINSDKSKIYLQILDENPEYLNHPRGPIYAMRDMEERMEESGKGSPAPSSGNSQREALRTARTALTGGGRTPERSSNTITLTKDQLEFCQRMELDPKDYAKQLLAQANAKKGAQL